MISFKHNDIPPSHLAGGLIGLPLIRDIAGKPRARPVMLARVPTIPSNHWRAWDVYDDNGIEKDSLGNLPFARIEKNYAGMGWQIHLHHHDRRKKHYQPSFKDAVNFCLEDWIARTKGGSK